MLHLNVPLTCLGAALALCAGMADARPGNGNGGGGGPKSWSAPLLSFSADRASYTAGETATLSWASINTRGCEASGDWSGKVDVEGSYRSPPLNAPATFVLTCYGQGNTSTTESVDLEVLPSEEPESSESEPAPEPTPEPEPEPAPPPEVVLSAAHITVASGGSTTLTWAADAADTCTASGGWTGSRPASGSERVGPLQQGTTFGLACSGPGGNVLEMLTVTVVSPVSLSWVGPTQNVDGSPLTDLAGYRLYVGLSRGAYGTPSALLDAGASSHELDLETGTYYLAMTAVDADGNESAFSNEIERTAP